MTLKYLKDSVGRKKVELIIGEYEIECCMDNLDGNDDMFFKIEYTDALNPSEKTRLFTTMRREEIADFIRGLYTMWEIMDQKN